MKPGKHQRPMSLLWFSLSHVIMTVHKENQHGDGSNVNVRRLTLYFAGFLYSMSLDSISVIAL